MVGFLPRVPFAVTPVNFAVDVLPVAVLVVVGEALELEEDSGEELELLPHAASETASVSEQTVANSLSRGVILIC